MKNLILVTAPGLPKFIYHGNQAVAALLKFATLEAANLEPVMLKNNQSISQIKQLKKLGVSA